MRTIPIISEFLGEVTILDGVEVYAYTTRPQLSIGSGVIHFVPDLLRWAQRRESVRRECEAIGIEGFSDLNEQHERQIKTIAWRDMQRYLNDMETDR